MSSQARFLEFETFDAYKEDVKNKLAETKQAQATAENENNVVQKVVDNASDGYSWHRWWMSRFAT